MKPPHLPHAHPPPLVPGIARQWPTGGGPYPHQPMPTPGPSSRWTMTTPNPAKLPGGQAVALVMVADMHPEHRSRHTPQAREQTPPKCDPQYTARVIAQMDHKDNCQTARWSGVGPGRGCGYAPWMDRAQITWTDTMDRPHEVAI
jgi:hypothetical protein